MNFSKNAYINSKIKSEKKILKLKNNKKFIYTILRPSSIYGIGLNKNKIIYKYFKELKLNKKLTIYDYENTSVNFIHAKDVARAIYLCLIYKKKGIFNLGSKSCNNFYDLTKIFKKIIKSKSKIELIKTNRPRLLRSLDVDIRKSIEELNWSPNIKLKKGLKMFVEKMDLKRTYIIAEAGINHNGNLSIAKKLIIAAKNSGADAIKFQTFIPEDVVTKDLNLASYQITNKHKKKEKMFNMIKKLYLNFNEQKQLLQLAKKINIDFISSAFDLGSLKFLYNDLNLKIIKIPSGEITNFPYLKEIAKKNTKVILSTGLSTLDEIKRALSILTSNKLKKKIFQFYIVTLHILHLLKTLI